VVTVGYQRGKLMFAVVLQVSFDGSKMLPVGRPMCAPPL
jgi:hypothetical protein